MVELLNSQEGWKSSNISELKTKYEKAVLDLNSYLSRTIEDVISIINYYYSNIQKMEEYKALDSNVVDQIQAEIDSIIKSICFFLSVSTDINSLIVVLFLIQHVI